MDLKKKSLSMKVPLGGRQSNDTSHGEVVQKFPSVYRKHSSRVIRYAVIWCIQWIAKENGISSPVYVKNNITIAIPTQETAT